MKGILRLAEAARAPPRARVRFVAACWHTSKTPS